ncbi:hypothetical protein CHLRE_04g223100v5 [Chlamydomonas reinhardtii]|uniref:Carbonic anhydrase 1 n=2 Tax=Chlamydomonas reinhardtii TaxID=3055 RepID=CAH1_CHLRE|nr:uncharacterized protein CHLRE_04g223100v5 [Chlamydomonas reinhardtii]P20507.1 RecName: Full=Carbonic anhydrase 1; AltName: Full=Carbonate dehydratase 1; Short=CA1; Contains: RecName: Full=Carbonic anhydrase 1 large chain; Contains: RecName: Full=Carbonic anhydrase 1 small chain; Flags: Precursor [Chlamydomonas reinhardtii]3B1B_A Chain A, Carbonic anhydrase 1 [Chlamydomonas reinhardtii]3B1B_B Chain B, Carbonic anhydrase 1 [Chlamydomonas reinhardtii]PNW84147.1 hypothetical protein CHLRE_04g223|eukprot:XP_001692291.1 carbonic anhydrase [Chlamydomonas reinhardtii]
MARTGALLLVALALAGCAQACIYKFGTSPDSKATVSGDHWDHGLNGENWEGKDGAGNAWVCKTGRKQSPINVPQYQVLDGKGSKIANGLQTQWSYPDLMSNGTSVQVINNGHTIQVQWTYNYAGHATIAIPAMHNQTNRIVDVLEMRPNDAADRVTAVPTQFHFHSTSEHLLAGKIYPLELHIVHQVTEKLEACKGGCFSVTGILFQLDNGPDNELLEPIFANMPSREGTFSNLPAGTTIKLGELLPSDRDYVTYEGSLTTPPCSEGLLWHVMTQPQRISFGQWNRYRLAVGLKECNSTETAADAGHHHHHRRLLHNHAHLEEVPAATSEPKHYFRRVMLAESANPDAYTCKAVAFGQNFRNPQYANGRTIKLARYH